MSAGIRYQTQLWLQAVKEAAAPSSGEHDPELILGHLQPARACGGMPSSKSPSPASWLLPRLCGSLYMLPE